MAVLISDLNITEGYQDNQKLTEAQLNASMASIETYVNTYLTNNLEQLAKDSHGASTYTFGNTGAALYTYNLFDKQTGLSSYSGGNIDIGTTADGAWASVDAVNAIVTMTPEKAGKYKVTFMFTHRATSSTTTEFTIETSFRLSDGTSASYHFNSGGYLPATAGNSGLVINPITISYIFTWADIAAKTIYLQKYNRATTAVNANVVCGSDANGIIMMSVEKI